MLSMQWVRAKPAVRVIGAVAGVVLLAGAMAVALRQVDFQQVAAAPWWGLALLGVGVAANLILSGLLFWVITLSFDAQPTVGPGRMTGLICVSALLNYLPLRVGMVGRTTYLKVQHRLPVVQSVAILLVVSVLSTLVLGGTALAVLLAGPGKGDTVLAVVLGVLLLIAPLTGPVARRLLRREVKAAWSWLPLRIADMLAGGLRFWLALWLLGSPLTFSQAIAAGAAGMLVALIGLTPNGLGMREWLQAGLTELLVPTSGAIGLTASLLDRAAEAIVCTLMGLVSLQWISRQPTPPALATQTVADTASADREQS